MSANESPFSLIGDDDVDTALDAIRQLRDLLEEHELRAVRLGRARGMSWQDLAEALGRQRSSVWERYHSEVVESDSGS